MSKAEWRDEYRFGRATMADETAEEREKRFRKLEELANKHPEIVWLADNLDGLKRSSETIIKYAKSCNYTPLMYAHERTIFCGEMVKHSLRLGKLESDINLVTEFEDAVVADVVTALVSDCDCKKQ